MLDTAPAPPSAALWHKGWLWLVLLRSPKIALGAPLLFGALGAIASAAGWNVADRLFISDTVASSRPLSDVMPLLQLWPGDRRPGLAGELGLIPAGVADPPADPITAMPMTFMGPLVAVCNPHLTWAGRCYFALGLGWSILIWAFFGGVIARIAVLRFTWDRRLEVTEAISFSRRKVWQHVAATLVPLLGVLTISVPIVLLALLMRLSIGAALGGLLWAGVLGLSLFSAMLAVGLLIGWPLIWGALATEDSDAFDAMSRSYAYAFQGAGRYAAYILFAALIGVCGWLVVWGFSETVIVLARTTAALGMGVERLAELTTGSADMHLNGLERFAVSSISFWETILRSVASGFAYAFFWTAFAGIYLLLRHDVESAPFDAVAGLAQTIEPNEGEVFVNSP